MLVDVTGYAAVAERYVYKGTTDLSDAIRLTERARKDGVDAELEVWDGMWHVWHLLARYVPEGQQAVDKIGAFIRKPID